MRHAPLEITASANDGRLVVYVTGELDMATADQLRGYVAGHTARLRAPRVVLELEGLAFCDSSGLSALIGIWKDLREAGGTVVLAAPRPSLVKILHATGLDTRLRSHPTLASALQDPQQGRPDTEGSSDR
ncbi:MAG: anti-sigma factor antagonist [Streptosporangiaceae bacterium]|nr:anti-sigma-factor antagonist [Streptosporangiaceae bacterium]MDX6433040.1 anti-sigma factor antagonist [Streptosporangiaceae bacterium]